MNMMNKILKPVFGLLLIVGFFVFINSANSDLNETLVNYQNDKDRPIDSDDNISNEHKNINKLYLKKLTKSSKEGRKIASTCSEIEVSSAKQLEGFRTRIHKRPYKTKR